MSNITSTNKTQKTTIKGNKTNKGTQANKQSNQRNKTGKLSNKKIVDMKKAPINKLDKKKEQFDDEDYTMLGGPNMVYKYYREEDDETMKKSPKRCMCINFKDANDYNVHERCKNTAISGSDFCEKHQNCTNYLRSFLSGSEPEYQPNLWSDPYVEGSHNCYSYFLNRQVRAVKEKCEEICQKKHKKGCPKKDNECSDLKPQPGDWKRVQLTGSDKGKERVYKCPHMQKKILTDNESIFPVEFNKKCPMNYYKGAMTVDRDNTYHFYRQDKNGMFSHKPGVSPVTDIDASGKKIYVPHFANRDYREDEDDNESIFYNNFCGYYCIPTNETIHKNLA
jgi:hypothetical protein